jgi:hypothetical protein
MPPGEESYRAGVKAIGDGLPRRMSMEALVKAE